MSVVSHTGIFASETTLHVVKYAAGVVDSGKGRTRRYVEISVCKHLPTCIILYTPVEQYPIYM